MSESKGRAISNGVTLTKPPEQLTFTRSMDSSPEETTGKATPSGRHSMEPSLQCSSAGDRQNQSSTGTESKFNGYPRPEGGADVKLTGKVTAANGTF